ncbi:hypothetical protein GCM10010277_05060 [Streptomyces longisporoflavus]|uniref:hypothetical protein n=1 Tax=Streptomyces longisporoflavus TaxID=28044 RepID=UPI00167E1BDE|nr:hypothetical protein [Streptomyces longisporoflavus]GGV24654.1 hypothetical protein GCM10010277_05060 [Streptomyces longisporoflavus]
MKNTRRKRRTTALLSATLGVAVAAVMSGCSSRVDDGPRVDWASDVCDSVQDVGAELKLPAADRKDAKKYHTQVVTFMEALDRQLGALDKKMRQDGAPPVDGGDATYKKALKNLRTARSSLAGTTSQLRKAKVTDEKSLKAALKKAGEGMDKAGGYQGPAHDFRADPALKQAFDKAPECENLPGTAPSAPSAG